MIGQKRQNKILKFNMGKDDFIMEFLLEVEKKFLTLPLNVLYGLSEYFFLLHKENEQTNLTAYHTIEDYVDFHLIDCMVLLDYMNPGFGSNILDVGTGAGIPGVLLNLLRPDLRIVLIESSHKKAHFLHKVLISIKNVDTEIIPRRAEEAAHDRQWRDKFYIVTSRALGSLSTTLELTAPFAKLGGRIYLPRSTEEFKIIETSKLLGCNFNNKYTYFLPRRAKNFEIVVFEKMESTPDRYPRKFNQIKKNPL